MRQSPASAVRSRFSRRLPRASGRGGASLCVAGLCIAGLCVAGAAAAADAPAAGGAAALVAAADLAVDLFAAEPLLRSPSDIDVDAKGRVWVCEVTNYRGRKDTRPEGDRILVLEDTDGDGRADVRILVLEDTDGDGRADK